MPPTLTSIAPHRGHTGGGTYVELRGTGFRLTPPAPDVLPAPRQLTRMRVDFGGVAAARVEVIDAETLVAFTPVHDPGPVDVVVQALDETPARAVTAAGPFALGGGATLTARVGVSADEQSVVLPGGTLTADELAALLNAFRSLRASVVGGRVQLQTDARGASVVLTLAGDARAVLGLPESAAGAATLEDVPGESATLVGSFAFLRPDLQVKAFPTLAIEALITELKRQVIANVHVATDSDFDPETGAVLNSAIVKVPSLTLADIQIPDSIMPVGRVPGEEETADGTSLVREAEDLVDVIITVVGVSDSPIEAVNLMSVCRRFFRKNGGLKATGCPYEDGYPLVHEFGSDARITAERNGENLHSFTMLVAIRGVPVGDMPIRDDGARPDGVPAGTRMESVTEVAWPQTDGPEVSIG